VDIRRISEPEAVMAAGHLFDAAPKEEATRRFLAESTHHLLIAYAGETPAGMVTGVETTHPDKGTEMFLYELGVDPAFRRQGIGTALVVALADLARSRGCYGTWTGTEHDNTAALATYARAHAVQEPGTTVLTWTFDSGGG
jgi:ribosomal protein S18 acetylase RimI-like enzyme